MSRTYLLSGAAVLIAIVLVAAYWYVTKHEFDADLSAAFERTADVYAYTQEDMTETVISDRMLRIEGIYRNDSRAGRYASIATTTISLPDDGEHSFTLENISLGEKVYTRVATESPLLKQQIAFDDAWHQFQRDAIPAEFESVAISGPILDHLLLFKSDGSYLTVVDGPVDDVQGDESLRVYTLRLRDGQTDVGGTLATFMERIGDGTIRIWIDGTDTIRRIAIDNDSFHSTTTLSRFNEPLTIDAPPIIE